VTWYDAFVWFELIAESCSQPPYDLFFFAGFRLPHFFFSIFGVHLPQTPNLGIYLLILCLQPPPPSQDARIFSSHSPFNNPALPSPLSCTLSPNRSSLPSFSSLLFVVFELYSYPFKSTVTCGFRSSFSL